MAHTKVTRSLQESTHGRLLATTQTGWVRGDVELGATLRIAEAVERIAQTSERVAQAVERIAQTSERVAQTIERLAAQLERLDAANQRSTRALEGLRKRVRRLEHPGTRGR